jgi:short-subunit dehydrogenase
MKLKPVKQQIIVITGATSGIGLVTARRAAERGARLVLTARNEDALERLTRELQNLGCEAIHVAGDVGDPDHLLKVADAAIRRFGGFDTWVNNAGVSVYGRLDEVPLADKRRVFDTNFWGVVHGCRAAVPHLRTRGGALINIGSTLSDRAIPLQGIYCASKHAVKGYTDALRMELEEEGAPISVTLIKPSAIDTPYKDHAQNYLEVEPDNPPPVYAPEAVADAILHCASHPERDVFIGAGGKMLAVLSSVAPRLTDKYMERAMFSQQRSEKPRQYGKHRGLYEPSGALEERGGYEGHVAETSIYTKSKLHPIATGAIVASAAGLVLTALATRRRIA